MSTKWIFRRKILVFLGPVSSTAVLCAAVSVFYSIQVYAEEARVTAGRVVFAAGKVIARSTLQKNKDGRQLRSGDYLHQGEVINTSSDGSAKLLLQDKTIIDIGPSSLFDIKAFKPNQGENREVEVEMKYGTVRAAVTRRLGTGGKFQLRTPSATMGVRGTEFVASAKFPTSAQLAAGVSAIPKTEVTVMQGKVEVQQGAPAGAGGTSAPQPIMLTAGQKIEANVGALAAPKVSNLSIDQLKQVMTTVKVEDNTFKNAVIIDHSNKESKNDTKSTGAGSSSGPSGTKADGKSSDAGAADDPSKTDSTAAAEASSETGTDSEKASEGSGASEEAGSATASAPPQGGSITQDIISETISAAAPLVAAALPPSAVTGGAVGVFNNGTALAPAPVSLTPGGLKRIKVEIQK